MVVIAIPFAALTAASWAEAAFCVLGASVLAMVANATDATPRAPNATDAVDSNSPGVSDRSEETRRPRRGP
ncbi:hypothetical protein CEP53_012821 [Fusarium sp. AF-6]|nr:hypothetical protein CEP53_012821 [Fusarium sp. AF-6]